MTGDFPDTKMDLSEYSLSLEESALGLQKRLEIITKFSLEPSLAFSSLLMSIYTWRTRSLMSFCYHCI